MLVLAAMAAPAAYAVPLGGTVLIDRPTGFGPLPFDGIGDSNTGFRGLTADGRFAVFSSDSNSLLSGDENSARNVYRVDLTTDALVQVDTTAAGGQPTPGSENDNASISADGNHVGFTTTSPALAPGASQDNPQFVVKNIATGAVEVASRGNGANGAPVANLQSGVLSGDGRHVAFTAESAVHAANATGNANTTDAYERDLGANTTEMVSVTDPGGAEGGGVFDRPDIDFAGDAVAFVTSASLVAGDTDNSVDAYVRTGIGGTEHTVLVSFSGATQPAGADAAEQVTLANGPAAGQLQLAWVDGNVWWAACTTTACNPATQADHAKTGGTDNRDNSDPFFPPQQSATDFPTRVYWETRDPLDPADTNAAFDTYGWDIGQANPDLGIHLMTGGDASNGTFGQAATNDGSVTTFSSSAPNLPGSNGLVEQAYVRRSGTDTNISQRLGLPTRTDDAGSAFIETPHVISDNGRFVAFSSDAPAFGAPILSDGPADQVLIRDVVTGSTRLVSAVNGSQIPGNDQSFDPSVDAAGNKVVFQSRASNLVPGDTNNQDDVFVRNLATGTTALVDRTAGGGAPTGGAFAGEISADGTKVVYLSRSPDIPGAAPDGQTHVYEVDLATGNVTLIDRTTAGVVANGRADQADIDGDGRRVAFSSEASNLGGGTNESVYVRDLTNPAHPTTTWISRPQDGSPAHDATFGPMIDRNGGRVAWTERNAAFGFGFTGTEQVYVRDIAGHTPTLASTGPGGPASTFAEGTSLSADGNHVAFDTNAPNLPGATPGFFQVYVRNLAARTTVLASARNGSAAGGRFGADFGALSANGACVAFDSNSDNLVAGGYSSDFEHVYLHALSAACPAPVQPPPPPPPPRDHTPPVISHFSVTHKRFALGPRPTAVSAAKHKKKVVRGTTFTFTLSERATVRIAITQSVKGHRAGHKKACKPARRGQKRNCTRTVTLVTLVRAHAVKGSNSVAFSGRYGHKRLAKGKYTATITATDAAHNRSKPHRLTFTVV